MRKVLHVWDFWNPSRYAHQLPSVQMPRLQSFLPPATPKPSTRKALLLTLQKGHLLSSTRRHPRFRLGFLSLARRYFPNAMLAAYRSHVVRHVLHPLIRLARDPAPVAFAPRGVAGLLRKAPGRPSASEKERLEAVLKSHPALTLVHTEMHDFRILLTQKHQPAAESKPLTPRLLHQIKR